jgi:hypothetical protein
MDDERQLVSTMARFTDQERAEIYAESCRLLEDNPPPEPTPAPEPTPEPPVPDPMQKWRADADAFAQQRAAERAKLQAASTPAPWWAARDVIMQHVAALEKRLANVEHNHAAYGELARACTEFSDVVSARLREIENLTVKLNSTLSTVRAAYEREVSNLRTQLATSENMRSRELALVAKQLAETQRALDQANASRERTRDREHVAELGTQVGNVVQLLREDIANRSNGAA